MPMNKQRGNMYNFISHTWNPIRGCLHKCVYCYVKNIPNYDPTVRLVKKELKYSLGEGNTIFVGSASDMFGDWVPAEWIERVLRHTSKFNNDYLFQSKNPRRFGEFAQLFPSKTVLGTTIETNRETNLSVAPPFSERVRELRRISLLIYPIEIATGALAYRHFDTMVSIEPIIDFDLKELVDGICTIQPKFVSVGADSKGHGLPEPSRLKIRELLEILDKFTEVRVKKNLRRLLR